jgi:transcriptional regulator of acetoin/glycerol metabolism
MAKADAHMPQTIIDALSQTGWNKARAARLLGMSRQTLYRKLIELNLPARPEVPQH